VWTSGPWWHEPEIHELLAEHTLVFAPMHRVRRPTSYYPFRETGLLVAVRGEVEAANAARLPVVSRPKLGPDHEVERVAVGVRCRAETRSLSLWNVHLENTTRPLGRELQARATVAAVTAGPAIVVGDFNTMLWPLERVERALTEAGFARAPLSGRWRLGPQLDHFFLRGVRPRRSELLDVRGSDHLPIFAEIDVER
jgi:endonuclease/exonuclease/phosphatase (EEP) superfamily protein YafD